MLIVDYVSIFLYCATNSLSGTLKYSKSKFKFFHSRPFEKPNLFRCMCVIYSRTCVMRLHEQRGINLRCCFYIPDLELPRGVVIGVDLLNIAPLDGAHFLPSHDITDPRTHARLQDLLADAKADVILSDMAPNASGCKDMDKEKLIGMCLTLIDLSEKILQPGGSLVCKYWDGFLARTLQERLSAVFGSVRSLKPKASRKESAEKYFLGKMYKGVK